MTLHIEMLSLLLLFALSRPSTILLCIQTRFHLKLYLLQVHIRTAIELIDAFKTWFANRARTSGKATRNEMGEHILYFKGGTHPRINRKWFNLKQHVPHIKKDRVSTPDHVPALQAYGEVQTPSGKTKCGFHQPHANFASTTLPPHWGNWEPSLFINASIEIFIWIWPCSTRKT